MNWAYLVRCADGSLYAGWTTDLQKRIDTHNAGQGAKYTRSRLPVTLAWADSFATKQEAMAKEWALKHLTREEKLRLAAGFNPAALQRTETDG